MHKKLRKNIFKTEIFQLWCSITSEEITGLFVVYNLPSCFYKAIQAFPEYWVLVLPDSSSYNLSIVVLRIIPRN
jgi:hypothetical protein